MEQKKRPSAVIAAIAAISTVAIFIGVGFYISQNPRAPSFSPLPPITLTGSWQLMIINGDLQIKFPAVLTLHQIQDDIYAEMRTQFYVYQGKGKRDGLLFVLELTNSLNPARKMRFYGAIQDTSTISGTYDAITGLSFSEDLKLPSIPSQGNWSGCKFPC